MVRFSKEQKEAIETPEGAKVLIQSMNKEMATLKKTIVQTQDELANMEELYHDSDKDNSVLRYINSVNSGVEVFKFIISAVGTGYGVNVASDGKKWGWLIVAGSALLYCLITLWQSKATKPAKKSNDS